MCVAIDENSVELPMERGDDVDALYEARVPVEVIHRKRGQRSGGSDPPEKGTAERERGVMLR